MAPCYSKNGILKGTVDFYCLVCETYLRSEADNIDHIAKPIHKTNLDSTQYVKDFEEDFIRKIKKRYFCELCNKLLPMMARVKIHVKEPTHIDSKNIIYFKRIGVNVVAFGKVVLNDKAWNGLHDESCAFCNTEYEDEDIHKSQLSHILNLIQIKVEVDENKNIYRKIDDVSFHCLTCNMVLALNSIERHFEEDQHKHLYQECCAISINEININELKEKDLNNVIEDQSDKTNDPLAIPVNNTGENKGQVHTARGSDVNTKCEVLKEITAIDATSLNEIGKNEKESEIALNSVVNNGLEDLKANSENCVANPLNKTTENKEESKTVKDNDFNKKNKNLADKKVKKNKTKINPSELNSTRKTGISNEIGQTISTSRSKSSFNIEEYENKICKILKTEDYIALDENGNTLCVLCDWMMDPKAKKIHINGLHHQTMEKMHKRRLKRLKETVRDAKETEMGDNNNIENTVQSTSVLDLVSKFQANNVNINLIFNTAVCKKCTVNLPYDVNAIEEHILIHQNETCKPENKVISLSCGCVINKETTENTSEVTIIENSNEGSAITDQNEEKLVIVEDEKENEPTNNKALVKIDELIISNKTPVNDKTKSDIAEPSVSINLQKQSLGNYIKIFTGINHMIFSDVVINEIICISASSFNYLISIKGEIKCLVCEEEVRDIMVHTNTLKHIKLLNEIPVIINEKTEFVREIHPELLHCGFCNMTVLSWSEMQEHLNSSSHKEIKDAAGWRMLMYSTEFRVENHNSTFSEISELSVRNMFSGLF